MPSNRMVSMEVRASVAPPPTSEAVRLRAQSSYAPLGESTASEAPIHDACGVELLLRRLHRVLDGLERRELHIVQLAAGLLDLTHVDVLDDVAGLRIDRDRPARALPLHPLHGTDQRISVGRAIGLLQRFIDQVHAVVAA